MSTDIPSYRQRIAWSLSNWPELSWLHRFLQTPTPANGDYTYANVFELIGHHFVAVSHDGDGVPLSQALEDRAEDSRLRLVLITHGDSWDVDRDVVDTVCNKYSLDPRFVARHFDYPDIQHELNCPEDLYHAIDRLYTKDDYPWELGGDLMFSLSMELKSCFFITYMTECLSFAIHQQENRSTLIIFLRAPEGALTKTSRIFFDYPGACVTRSLLPVTQPAVSLSMAFTTILTKLYYADTMTENGLILRLIMPYITDLTACCNANYYRNIAPTVLGTFARTGSDSLFEETRRLVTLRRQIKAFLTAFDDTDSDESWEIARGEEACRSLRELAEDLESLSRLHRHDARSYEFENLKEMMEAQVNEAKQAKSTSVKLGYLIHLAYVFLPLQLTASTMGMNLQIFGAGTIELRTFLAMFITIALLSFVPVVFPLVSFEPPIKDRISQVYAVFKLSHRAGLLFGSFCLFHQQSINDKLWDSGISADVSAFLEVATEDRPIKAWERARRRTAISKALRSGPFGFFPRYWQGVLDELFKIIDAPEWGRVHKEKSVA